MLFLSIEAKLEESLLAGEQMKQKLVDAREQMQKEMKSVRSLPF